jgi:HK97 family phage major capsid protein
MTTPANKGVIDPELKTALDALRAGIAAAAPASKLQALQTQVDAIDLRNANKLIGGSFGVSLKSMLESNEDVSRLLRDKRGKAFIKFEGAEQLATLHGKSIISATVGGSSEGDPLLPVGVSTSGVLQIDRTAGITTEARQKLKIRDVLTATPTSLAVVDFLKVSTPMSIASPVAEASIKPENQLGFTSVSEKVRLIATWIPATKQVLDDLPSLMSIIQGSLLYYIDLEEELQLLAGDDTGENLHGLLPQAQAFNTGLLHATSGWQMIDVIGMAIQQINSNKELDPSFVILHTQDYWKLRLTKDSLGRYLLGDPQTMVRPNIFGLDLVYTTSIPQGTFLVGSGNQAACEIKDRMETVVEISLENSDYFVRNLVAIRGERRLCLLTKRPNSFVSGSFSTSPA